MDKIAFAVEQLYKWLDNASCASSDLCRICGDCCDFDTFGHKLFVTTPELIYLSQNLPLKKMTTSRCPWQDENKCTIHIHRFASCRIFFCKGNTTTQADLSEIAVKKLKTICQDFHIPYNYMDLRTALENADILLK